jgi:hypothetical protein
MKYYHRIVACVTYQAYEFKLDGLTQQHYARLNSFVQPLGDNTYPLNFKVLHIKHKFFFLDFPAYGFPVFKISFYQWTPPEQITYYLELINNYFGQLLQ